MNDSILDTHREEIKDWIKKRYGTVSVSQQALFIASVQVMGGTAVGCGASETEAMKNLFTDLSTVPWEERAMKGSIYVASRASVPERGQMWRELRRQGINIISSWIDEDGQGETGDFGELWKRITNEISKSDALVLFAEASDFPLKGAFIEAGIALGMGLPVIVCLPGIVLDEGYRPIGSWINHPLVSRVDDIESAINLAIYTRAGAGK